MSNRTSDTELMKKMTAAKTTAAVESWNRNLNTPIQVDLPSPGATIVFPTRTNEQVSDDTDTKNLVDSSRALPKIPNPTQTLTPEEVEEFKSRLALAWGQVSGINIPKLTAAVLQKRINRRNELFSFQRKSRLFTTEMRDMKDGGVLPYYATNFAEHGIRFEMFDRVGNKNFLKDYQDIAFSPEAFQTYTDYVQGNLNLPKSPTLKGDVSNVFLTEVKLEHVYSTYPFDLAVVIGFLDKDNYFVQLDGDTQAFDRSILASWDDNKGKGRPLRKRCHGIIPRNASNFSVRLFQSGCEINEEYGALFPNATDDVKTLIEGCDVLRQVVYLPRNGILCKWLYEYGYLYGIKPPPITSDGITKDDTVYCTVNEFNTAIQGVRELISQNVPIRNMGRFQMKIYPLVGKTGMGKEVLTDIMNQLEPPLKIADSLKIGDKGVSESRLFTLSASLVPTMVFRTNDTTVQTVKFNDGDMDPDIHI